MADETPQAALARLQAAEAQCADDLAKVHASPAAAVIAAAEAQRVALVLANAALSDARQAVADQTEAVALADAQAARLAEYAALDQENDALAARLTAEYPEHVAALSGLLADLKANARKVRDANIGFAAAGIETMLEAEFRARQGWGLSGAVVLPSFTPGHPNEWPAR